MTLAVNFHNLDKDGNDTIAGIVTWDGQKIRVQGPKWLVKLMGEPIGSPWPEGKGLKKVTFKDGEAFLQGLPYQYHGTYFCASKVFKMEDKNTQS